MKSKRKLIITGITLAVLIIVVVGIAFLEKIYNNADNGPSTPAVYFKTLSDGTLYNTSPKLQMPKQFEGLDITNIQLTCTQPVSTNNVINSMIKGVTDIIATVTNNTDQTLGGYGVEITFVDEKGVPISNSKVYVEIIQLKPGATAQLHGGITENLVNAYDIQMEKVTNE
ncbi:MAG: hypothetical protein FWF46_02325 [Oscillospiraceae bacterium]|nr:hypothetical protein [Oscillospiraceae bacterium]